MTTAEAATLVRKATQSLLTQNRREILIAAYNAHLIANIADVATMEQALNTLTAELGAVREAGELETALIEVLNELIVLRHRCINGDEFDLQPEEVPEGERLDAVIAEARKLLETL